MQRSETSPDDFLASLPDDVRDDMVAIDGALAPVFAGDERVLWEGPFWGGTQQHIIGYGSYHYRVAAAPRASGSSSGLAAQKKYLVGCTSMRPTTAMPLTQRYASRLGKVKAARSNLQVKHASDLDLDVLRELAARAREVAPKSG